MYKQLKMWYNSDMKLNLETILDMWKEDSQISNTSLDEVSRVTPMMHAKYLELRSTAKLQLKRFEMQQKILLKDKWLYYNGKMDAEQIAAHGWEFDPFNGLKVLKGEMEHYYDSDLDIQKSEEKIVYWKTIVETLEEIVTSLNWRHQTIGNMIRWRMFEAGS
jgi:hypothetical protein